MIKIAFVIDTIESPTAGTEKQLILLIKHLDRSRFQPFLCVLRSSRWLDEHFDLCPLQNIKVDTFKSIRGWEGILNLSEFFQKAQIDIVQTHFRDSSIAGIIAAKITRVKIIVGTRRNQGYWHTSIELAIQKLLNHFVSVFITNAENTKEWATSTEGIKESKLRVIYNGLELERYFVGTEHQRLTFKQQLELNTDAILLGIVANLRPVKAVDVFLNAAKLILNECPRARFIIVGDGTERERLVQLAAELGIAAHVRFLGKRRDIPEILSCLDIGILSSNSESLSNAILEYMASGLSVVCTDVGGARELIEDGIHGFLVKSGDYTGLANKVIELILSEKYMALGKNCRNKTQKLYGINRVTKEYENCYEEAMLNR